MEGPTTEKARRCLIAKRARGTRSSPLVVERSARRAATSDTGRQRCMYVYVAYVCVCMYVYSALVKTHKGASFLM